MQPQFHAPFPNIECSLPTYNQGTVTNLGYKGNSGWFMIINEDKAISCQVILKYTKKAQIKIKRFLKSLTKAPIFLIDLNHQNQNQKTKLFRLHFCWILCFGIFCKAKHAKIYIVLLTRFLPNGKSLIFSCNVQKKKVLTFYLLCNSFASSKFFYFSSFMIFFFGIYIIYEGKQEKA